MFQPFDNRWFIKEAVQFDDAENSSIFYSIIIIIIIIIISVVVIIIIIIIIIPFMQGIYTHIPTTNHASREYSVAAIL